MPTKIFLAVCLFVNYGDQTNRQTKNLFDGGGIIMASIMELEESVKDNSRRISGLNNLNLETTGGEAMKERTLNLLRREQVLAHGELQDAKEKEEIRQVREIFSSLPEG